MAEISTITPTQDNHPEDLIMVKNPTNVDFTFEWDSIPHTVKAGEEMPMQRWMAVHFAKHLITAIINSQLKKVKVGDETRDNVSTNDPRLRSKLAPHVLLYVVRRFVEPPVPVKSNKKIVTGPEDYDIPEEKHTSNVKIELPENVQNELGDLINISEAENAPEALQAPVSEVPPEPANPPEGSGKPPTEVQAAPSDATSRQDMVNELMAMGVEITGQESDEELASMIAQKNGRK